MVSYIGVMAGYIAIKVLWLIIFQDISTTTPVLKMYKLANKKPISLVTGNRKKLEEFLQILGEEFKNKVCIMGYSSMIIYFTITVLV